MRCGQEPVAVKSRWSNRQDEDLLLCRARRARCHGPAHITLCTCSSSPSNPDGATVLSGKYHSATENAGSGTCKLGNVDNGASRGLPTVSTSRRARASRLWPRRPRRRPSPGWCRAPTSGSSGSTPRASATTPTRGMSRFSTGGYLAPFAQAASGSCRCEWRAKLGPRRLRRHQIWLHVWRHVLKLACDAAGRDQVH